MNKPPPADRPEQRGDWDAAIKGATFGGLIAGAVCLYFGFQWLVDAPASADESATAVWYAIDQGFRWALRVIGAAFFLVALLARSGSPASALLATVVESAFALLMLAMAVDTLVEARADGQFDATVILLLVLMAVGISAARHSWLLYRRTTVRHDLM